MPTTSNFGWTTPADTDLVKDGAAAIRTLGNGIDTSFLDLKGGTSGQVLSKNSNTDLDYAWVTPNVGDITEVQAGTGISVASGTGPIPVVTNSMATEITAKGDLIVGTGSGTFDNLPAGTNGYTLVADSSVSPTGLKWAAPAAASFVGCAVYASSQTITKGIYNKLAYANEDFDTDAFHDNVTNNTRITIPSGKGGKYVVCGLIQFDTTTDAASVHLYKNGGLFNSLGIYEGTIQQGRNHAGNNNSGIGGTVTISLAATDYIELAYYSSGSGSGTCSNSRFSVAYLGA